jgi:hypothetical protein
MVIMFCNIVFIVYGTVTSCSTFRLVVTHYFYEESHVDPHPYLNKTTSITSENHI